MSNSFLLKYQVFAIVCVFAAQNLAAQSQEELLDQLRADYVAILDATAEFDQAKQNGSINDAEKADYAAWLQQLDDQFTGSCHTLSASSAELIPADIPCTEFTSAYVEPLNIDIEHENTDAEKTAVMVDQFEQSLGDFDEKLLTEQDRVKSQKPRVESSSSSAGADGGGVAGGEQGENSAEEGGQEKSQGSQVASGTTQTAGSAAGSASAGNRPNIPDDIPDGSDDDVIARQLREAAEKETDPELQKKLWEEYRRYKSGR